MDFSFITVQLCAIVIPPCALPMKCGQVASAAYDHPCSFDFNSWGSGCWICQRSLGIEMHDKRANSAFHGPSNFLNVFHIVPIRSSCWWLANAIMTNTSYSLL